MSQCTVSFIRQEFELYRKNHVKQQRLEARLRRDGTNMPQQQVELLDKLRYRNSIVEGWLELLSEDEEYVIRRHLIDGLTWPQIEAEYAEKWKQFSKCSRTLMRYQQYAFEHIKDFIDDQENENSPI